MHECVSLDWVLEWIERNFASRWRLKRHICSYFLYSWFFCLWSSDEESLKIPFGVHSNRRARISALNKTGMCELRALIEDGIIDSTGREIKIIVVPPDGPQLRWRILYFWLYNNSEIWRETANGSYNTLRTCNAHRFLKAREVLARASTCKYARRFLFLAVITVGLTGKAPYV